MNTRSRSQSYRAQKLAIAMVAPAAFVFVAAGFLIPWMIETKRRLQNEYWETQLVFATFALALASTGLPFLVLRAYSSRRVDAIISWVVVLLGHCAIYAYIVQSHFSWDIKLIVGTASTGLAWASMIALVDDWSRSPR